MKGLSCGVVNFGHKVTADRMTLRAFLDSDGDADLVPVDRVRLFNRFNRVTVDLWERSITIGRLEPAGYANRPMPLTSPMRSSQCRHSIVVQFAMS